MIFLLISPNKPKQTFKFEANSSITVGRSSSCDIVLLYKFISRIHCTLVLMYEDRKFYYLLFDGEILGKKSTYGTWVNKEKIEGKYRVRNKDKITFYKDIDALCLIALSDDELDTESGRTLAQE